jgi:tetratricopeptide (TPR) repeat protein
MPTDYREIGNEILEELKVDATRLGEALSTLNEVVRERLDSAAWDEVPTQCESARKLSDEVWSNAADHVEGIFHAYEGISHLYKAGEAREKKNPSEESAELAKAIDCLKKSQQSFHFEDRDWWNEVVLYLNLGRLYRSQNKSYEALLAFQGILDISGFRGLSNEKKRGIEKIVSAELKETRMHFSAQRILAPYAPKKLPPPTQQKATSFKIPIIDEIATGKEKPVSDGDTIGHIQETDASFDEVLWLQFVKKAGAVAIWDRESQKVISPLKEKLPIAFELISKESKPEEWEPLRKAISDFCQYSFSTQVSKTLVEELRQLVAELVGNIIAGLSTGKHLASVEQYLKDLIKPLQRL